VWCGCAADTRAVFKTVEYTEESYQQELEHIEEVSTVQA